MIQTHLLLLQEPLFPAATVPIIQTPAPVNQPINLAAVAPVPPQAANHLTYQAVPANSSAVALFNNVRGNAAQPLAGRTADVVTQAFQADNASGQLRQADPQRFGFNSAFLTFSH